MAEIEGRTGRSDDGVVGWANGNNWPRFASRPTLLAYQRRGLFPAAVPTLPPLLALLHQMRHHFLDVLSGIATRGHPTEALVCRILADQLHVGLAQHVQQTHQRAGIGHEFMIAIKRGCHRGHAPILSGQSWRQVWVISDSTSLALLSRSVSGWRPNRRSRVASTE